MMIERSFFKIYIYIFLVRYLYKKYFGENILNKKDKLVKLGL